MNRFPKRFLASIASLCVLLFLIIGLAACNKREGKARVLVFSKETYFFHTSIPNGIAAIQKLGQENNFDVDTTTNSDWFTEDTLKKYAAVIFLHNADDKSGLLNSYQEAAFEPQRHPQCRSLRLSHLQVPKRRPGCAIWTWPPLCNVISFS